MEEELPDKLNYVYSCYLTNRIQIKIGTFEGNREKPNYRELIEDPILKYSGLNQKECSDLMIECQVFSQNIPIALPICTSYKSFNKRYNWNEWITLPVQFNDLPKDALLAITIYDCGGPRNKVVVGGTTISLFGKYGLFREGIYDLRVWPSKVADGKYPSTTPGKLDKNFSERVQRLSKLVKNYRQGYVQRVDWLDRLAFRKLEHINEKEKHRTNFFYLMIEFPIVHFDKKPHHVIYFEPESEEVRQFRSQADIVTVPDYEILKENLVESKHHKLARSLRSGYSDKDAKPNAIVRDLLHKIVSYPPTKQLSNEEQDQLWKFRYYLSNQKKALTKFLKCINWTQNSEVRQALTMLEIWAPMDVEDALELLSKNFTHPTVRRYAISKLKQAPDEDLLLYLLQLVQALKYENFDDIIEAHKKIINMAKESRTKKKDGKTDSPNDTNNQSMIGNQLTTSSEPDQCSLASTPIEEPESSESSSNDTILSKVAVDEDSQDLASFLIDRACQNSTLANYFYWYLVIECEQADSTVNQDMVVKDMYIKVRDMFYQKLLLGGSEWKRTSKILKRQEEFVNKLVGLVKTVSSESGSRTKKEEKLQELLADPKLKLASFEPLPLPLDPEIQIKGIIPENASLFKSALMPMKLHFMTTDVSEYVAIFKHGDDLRQDQLILQMITLMDKLLMKENLDLKLTPYRVLATSSKHGLLQFINSHTIASVLNQYNGNLLNFFKKHHPANNHYGIAPETMDTYVKSCAGYCVITYLLGVGDRHLDNLLITENGNLFHIDFGYILGRDPKPLPPPMKLSKEMVEGMGGMNSDHYKSFKDICYNTYLILRRHANLILNLFQLMVDANVPDIALEPDKAVKKVQDNLCLDLTDEAAIAHLQSLIDMSATAVMAALVEHIHKFAQYWRR